MASSSSSVPYRQLGEGDDSSTKKNSIWNRNVKTILLYTFVVQMARSIWQSQILSIYLYDLCDDMRVVGYIEGIQGVCRLITALITGYVVDNCLTRRKNAALRFTCFYGIVLFAAAAYCTSTIHTYTLTHTHTLTTPNRYDADEKDMDMVRNISYVLTTKIDANVCCGCDLCRFDENR